jgi:hypothetical protein
VSVAITQPGREARSLLKPLSPQRVVEELVQIADGEIPVLLCWEKPILGQEWCHRGLVSAWLFGNLGLKICEYGLETFGFGWQHPMLHPSVR